MAASMDIPTLICGPYGVILEQDGERMDAYCITRVNSTRTTCVVRSIAEKKLKIRCRYVGDPVPDCEIGVFLNQEDTPLLCVAFPKKLWEKKDFEIEYLSFNDLEDRRLLIFKPLQLDESKNGIEKRKLGRIRIEFRSGHVKEDAIDFAETDDDEELESSKLRRLASADELAEYAHCLQLDNAEKSGERHEDLLDDEFTPDVASHTHHIEINYNSAEHLQKHGILPSTDALLQQLKEVKLDLKEAKAKIAEFEEEVRAYDPRKRGRYSGTD